MTPLLSLVAILGALTLCAFLLRRTLSVRRRQQVIAEREARARSLVRLPDGSTAPLPDALWSLAAPGAADVVIEAAGSSRSENPQDVWDAAAAAVDRLDPERATQYASEVEEYRLLDREIDLWESQRTFLLSGAEVGVLDAAVIALSHSDMWNDALGSVTGGLAQYAVSSSVPSDLFPDFLAELEAQASQAVGDATGNAVAETLESVADMHIPVFTVLSALRSANRARAAGVDGDRVTDNLVVDIGAKGGGVLAGAMLGTAVFPGLGTLVGGAIGALIGGELSREVKGRHLEAAQEDMWRQLEALGRRVEPDGLAVPCRSRRAQSRTHGAAREALRMVGGRHGVC